MSRLDKLLVAVGLINALVGTILFFGDDIDNATYHMSLACFCIIVAKL